MTLRDLTIAGSSAIGINFTTGKALHVERCMVGGPAIGIYSLGSGNLFVRDSTVSGSASHGIIFLPDSNSATATVEHCRLTGNGGIGLIVVRGLATVHDSVFAENDVGVGVSNGLSGPAELNIDSCVSANNGYGILVTNPEATLRLSNTTVTDNTNFGIE